MSDSCKCFDIEVEVILDEPEFDGELDFDGEVITCSDGEDYKRGYEDGHAQGLIDGQADGYKKGYDEGHKVGSESGYSLGKQEGLTEGYDNGYEKGKQDGYEQGYSEGYTKGYEQGKAEGNTDLLQYATFVSGYVFYYAKFPENYEVKFKIAGGEPAFNYLFFGSNAQKVSIESTGQLKKVTATYTFLYCTQLTTVKFVNEPFPIGNGTQTFNGCSSLKTIEGTIDLSQNISNGDMFNGCKSLEEVRFVEQSIKLSISFSKSPNLTDASVDSIANGLADMTGQNAPTIQFHADVKAKLTEEQIATITGKNWTLA